MLLLKLSILLIPPFELAHILNGVLNSWKSSLLSFDLK